MTTDTAFPRVTTWELARAIAEARFAGAGPLYLIHSLTNRCNARCGFCAWQFYQDAGDELSTAEIKGLYREAREAGIKALSLWGGEPLLHRDVGEIARYAHETLGMRTHMVTNGALLLKKMDRVLPHIDRFCISLDHPSERHDQMRGIPGLFQRIVDASRALRRRAPEKKLLFVYTFQRGNTDPATVERAAELFAELGAVGVFNAMRLEPASAAPGVDLTQYNPEPEALSRAFATVRGLKLRGLPVLNSFTHLAMMEQGPPRYRCHWPKFIVPVEANGDVVDCMHWGTRPVDNVRRTPFGEILRGERLRALAGPAGEACCKCVSIHRVELSEAAEGRLEPLLAWASSLAF